MLTRRRFLGYTALAPAALSPRFWGNAQASPQISARALAVHKRALVFDGHVHALDREFYHGGSMGTRNRAGNVAPSSAATSISSAKPPYPRSRTLAVPARLSTSCACARVPAKETRSHLRRSLPANGCLFMFSCSTGGETGASPTSPAGADDAAG